MRLEPQPEYPRLSRSVLGLCVFRGTNPGKRGASLDLLLTRRLFVQLTILEVSGRSIRTLLGGALPAGRHEVTWDGKGAGGRPVVQGLYLARLADAAGRALAPAMKLVVVK